VLKIIFKGKKGRRVMFRKVLILTAIISVFSACEVQAAVIDSNWIGGERGEWGDANNWFPMEVPDNDVNTFVVTIDGDSSDPNEVEIGLQQSRTIDQLDCYGAVELIAWTSGWVQLTLADPNGLTNYGGLWIEEIGIIGDVTNTNGARLELLDVEIDGDLYNVEGGTILAEVENDVEGDLQNDGALIIIHASDLLCDSNLYNNGQINLYGGECGVDETLDNNSNGVIKGFGVIGSEGTVDNKGEIIAFGGSLALQCNYMNQDGTLSNTPVSSLQIDSEQDVDNYGAINVNAGGGVAFDCNLVNDSAETDGIIKLLGGSLAARNITQSAGATFSGFGSITGNLTIQDDATIELDGPTNIVGNVTIDSGAILRVSAGQTLITGHTTNNGTIVLAGAGGTVIFQGGYSGSGEIIDAIPSDVIIDNGDDGTSYTGSWKVSNASGFYGSSSLWCTDLSAGYSFEAWVVGTRAVSLWWTSAPNRSNATSVQIYDGDTLIDTVAVNQQINGGQWNSLGSYAFTDKAKVKIISDGSAVVVADAVKFAPASEIIIDNGDSRTSSVGSWKVSNASGFYGVSSLWCADGSASYSFEAWVLGNRAVSLWWTSAPNRAVAASVEIYDGATLLDTVTVNQQINGGQWNSLGSYAFTDKATVKIISAGGVVTVADAVKFAPW
jgi:hypothetical protein